MVSLPHHWTAIPDDAGQRFVLSKPSRRSLLVLQWSPPFLRPIDETSNTVMTGPCALLPDDVLGPLLDEAERRWG